MDNNLKVLVTAELDKLKSVTQINQDIKKIDFISFFCIICMI